MKYMLLIHRDDTPTPRSPDGWARLSEDERLAIYADHRAINETSGVSSGAPAGRSRDGDHRSATGWKALTTDGSSVELKEAIGGYRLAELG